MGVKDAVSQRFQQILAQRRMTANELAVCAGVTPSSVYSMLDENRRNVSIVLIKKLCDGLEMSLREFFDSPLFDELEQEIV